MLLDTHVLLWFLQDSPHLPADLAHSIEQAPVVTVSVASLWEIAIKQGLGRLSVPADFLDTVRLSGLTVLPITAEHAMAAGRLPWLHRDPFDRMLVAVSQVDRLALVSADPQVLSYQTIVVDAR